MAKPQFKRKVREDYQYFSPEALSLDEWCKCSKLKVLSLWEQSTASVFTKLIMQVWSWK